MATTIKFKPHDVFLDGQKLREVRSVGIDIQVGEVRTVTIVLYAKATEDEKGDIHIETGPEL